MRFAVITAFLCSLLALSGSAFADAPLKSKLGLDTGQAKQVQAIQKEYRRTFGKKRQAFNRESRALRRARRANDSEQIAKLETVTAALEQEMRSIRLEEHSKIKQVLTPEQTRKFDALIAEQRASVGSSRDDRIFKK